jgi:AcrR family transcriptional regulator
LAKTNRHYRETAAGFLCPRCELAENSNILLNRLFVNLIWMTRHAYRLGRRQAEVDRTRARILAAAGELVAELGPSSSLGKVAERAGVSRVTVYNQFGSKARLLDALTAKAGIVSQGPPPGEPGDPAGDLTRRIEHACAAWAENPDLYRQLAAAGRHDPHSALDHELALRLAAQDRLRPGCSIKEAEDVIGILTSFPVFDRLHQRGRRSASGVAEILLRMASIVMTALPPV